MLLLLVVCCCHNKHYKLSNLNNKHLLRYGSEGQKFDPGFNIEKQVVDRAAFLPAGSGGESVSLLIEVVGRIQFLVVIGLRFQSPCW